MRLMTIDPLLEKYSLLGLLFSYHGIKKSIISCIILLLQNRCKVFFNFFTRLGGKVMEWTLLTQSSKANKIFFPWKYEGYSVEDYGRFSEEK